MISLSKQASAKSSARGDAKQGSQDQLAKSSHRGSPGPKSSQRSTRALEQTEQRPQPARVSPRTRLTESKKIDKLLADEISEFTRQASPEIMRGLPRFKKSIELKKRVN